MVLRGRSSQPLALELQPRGAVITSPKPDHVGAQFAQRLVFHQPHGEELARLAQERDLFGVGRAESVQGRVPPSLLPSRRRQKLNAEPLSRAVFRERQMCPRAKAAI